MNYLKRCKTSNLCFFASRHLVLSFYPCRGMERTYERTYEAPSNEAPRMILGYHQGRLVTYLQNNFSLAISRQWQPAKPRPACRFSNSFPTKLSVFHLTSLQCLYGLSRRYRFGLVLASSSGFGNGNFLILSRVLSRTHSCQVYIIGLFCT